jgi:hypothetical protein
MRRSWCGDVEGRGYVQNRQKIARVLGAIVGSFRETSRKQIGDGRWYIRSHLGNGTWYCRNVCGNQLM